MSTASEKLRVIIVGAGAAGMSAAYALSQHPERYSVKVYERSSSPGGMATSVSIDNSAYGAEYINDGVQGASPTFHNTYAMFDKLGYKTSEVDMQVSFGKDVETEFWSNVFPGRVIDKYQADIKKFGKVLKIIKALEPLFVFISISLMLRIFRFSNDFGNIFVLPLAALFFGTGNQTPYVSCAILERVFMDPYMRLFEYSSETFLSTVPKMRSFPRLSSIYSTWKDLIESESHPAVQVIVNREVTRVKRHSGRRGSIEVWSRKTNGTDNNQDIVNPGEEEMKVFDEIIFCTDAEAALKILGDGVSWLERRILGNVKYVWDVTVTHNDLNYMEKYYQIKYHPTLDSQKNCSADSGPPFDVAKRDFRPLYFVRSVPEDKNKIEMSFDLTVYQPQFERASPHGSGSQPVFDPSSDMNGSFSQSEVESENSQGRKIPLEKHVFQTIFLDKSLESSKFWTKGDIDPEKVILEKWWKQQSHRWQHYAGTVPWMGLINGRNHTRFAGAWTILNMHEIGIVSGFAAAYQLGASYPFSDRPECKRLFALCLAANHMTRMRKEDRAGIVH